MSDKVNELNATETAPHEWWAEASELRLEVGAVWPQVILTSLGNGLPFVLASNVPDVARYRQTCGCATLIVFND